MKTRIIFAAVVLTILSAGAAGAAGLVFDRKGVEVTHTVESFDQKAAFADGILTFVEYESAITNAIVCARKSGVDVSDPVLGIDGVTLDYSVSEHGIGEDAIIVFDDCYETYAHAVDLAFQTSIEVVDQRERYIDEMYDCVFGQDKAKTNTDERTLAVLADAPQLPEFDDCRAASTQDARSLTVDDARNPFE